MSDLNISMNGEMSVLAFSEYTGVSRSTTYRMIDSGKLVANDNGSLKVIDALKFKTRELMQNNYTLFTFDSLSKISNIEHQLSHGHALNMNELISTIVDLFELYLYHNKATLPDVNKHVMTELFNITEMILDHGYDFVSGSTNSYGNKQQQYLMPIIPLFEVYKSYLLKHYGENDRTYLIINNVLLKSLDIDDVIDNQPIFIALFKTLKWFYLNIDNVSESLKFDYQKSFNIMLSMLNNNIRGSNQVNMLRLNTRLYDLIELTLCIHLDGVKVK